MRQPEDWIVGPGTKGKRLKLICAVLDGDAMPVNDAMIEVWQANADGQYNHPEDLQQKPTDSKFTGFGRTHSDESGLCIFETIRPGRVPGWGNVFQAPHLNLSVFARGILKRLATRVYFADDPANAEDPVLALVPEGRRDTLMAHADPKTVWTLVLRDPSLRRSRNSFLRPLNPNAGLREVSCCAVLSVKSNLKS